MLRRGSARLRRMAAGTSDGRFISTRIRRVDGNVGACADGDAGVGTGQGQGIVDASPTMALLRMLQLDDRSPCRRAARLRSPRPTCISANGSSGALVVTGEHDHADALACSSDGAGLSSLDGIGHRDDAQQTACSAEEQGRFALCGKGCGLLLRLCGHGDFGADKGRIAAKKISTPSLCGQTVARQGGKTSGYLRGGELLRVGARPARPLPAGARSCAPVRRQG